MHDLQKEDARWRLIWALRRGDPYQRSNAVKWLSERGGAFVVGPLLEALRDEDASIRAAAAAGLGKQKSRRAVRPLCKALWDDRGALPVNAAEALAAIGSQKAVAPMLRRLGELLEEEKPNQSAVEALCTGLGELGDPCAKETLRKAFVSTNGDFQTRKASAGAMAKLRDTEGLELILDTLLTASESFLEFTTLALREAALAIDPERVLQRATEVLAGDSSRQTRERALELVRWLEDPRVVTLALKYWEPRPLPIWAAVSILARQGGERAAAALATELAHHLDGGTDPVVEKMAVALADCGDSSAAPLVYQAYKRIGSYQARKALARMRDRGCFDPAIVQSDIEALPDGERGQLRKLTALQEELGT